MDIKLIMFYSLLLFVGISVVYFVVSYIYSKYFAEEPAVNYSYNSKYYNSAPIPQKQYYNDLNPAFESPVFENYQQERVYINAQPYKRQVPYNSEPNIYVSRTTEVEVEEPVQRNPNRMVIINKFR